MTASTLNSTNSIATLSELTTQRYFETMNAGDYQETAKLFAPEGILNAPFEEPIVGESAIVAYLETEAKGMQLFPQQSVSKFGENNFQEIQVSGKVKTPVFNVNVAWLFVLNSQQEIVSVTVKLLASPAELLNLRPATKF